jgi:HlyD family secretion protein
MKRFEMNFYQGLATMAFNIDAKYSVRNAGLRNAGLLLLTGLLLSACGASEPAKNDPAKITTKTEAKTTAKPALTVNLTSPVTTEWPYTLSANGNVSAWQEASVGADVGGLRLAEVLVGVGDSVKRGQVLARLAETNVQVDLAQQRASIAEAEATLADARANAERARQLDQTGAISAQQIQQLLTAERTAEARLELARARLRADQIRLDNTGS